ncbi:hypothetical protein F511_14626 [Dorcoceras hygrometricum]|uniref:Uncharacterized protein n=1 Tax=Dorcoceras hygrometricum TaxID=472368 RepID=A0A2Z6ZY95_9LAMI|nr:hypothetical protein F511_14626 [Dorcoceras hygrometricum]
MRSVCVSPYVLVLRLILRNWQEGLWQFCREIVLFLVSVVADAESVRPYQGLVEFSCGIRDQAMFGITFFEILYGGKYKFSLVTRRNLSNFGTSVGNRMLFASFSFLDYAGFEI